ncbi:MAG: PKD domain-containing protein [Candidatus Thermoplasmatota archaeon]
MGDTAHLYKIRNFISHTTKLTTFFLIALFFCNILIPSVAALAFHQAQKAPAASSIYTGTGMQPPIARIIVTPGTQGSINQLFTFDASTSTQGYVLHNNLLTSESLNNHVSYSRPIQSLQQMSIPLAHDIVLNMPHDIFSIEQKNSDETIAEKTEFTKKTPSSFDETQSSINQENSINPVVASTNEQNQETLQRLEPENTNNHVSTEPLLGESPSQESDEIEESTPQESYPTQLETPPETGQLSDEQLDIIAPEPEQNPAENQPPQSTSANIYHWDFGDGTTATGMIVTHQYTDYGYYTVLLTFTDVNGLTDTETVLITIMPEKPTLFGTFTDHGFKLYWDENSAENLYYNIYKDSTYIGYTTGTQFYITTIDNAFYQITAAVECSDGTLESEKSNGIHVTMQRTLFSPVAIISESSTFGFQGKPILFDGSESYSPNGEIIRYQWMFGDGTTGFGKYLYHTYSKKGNYTVSLTVTDEYNQTDTTSILILVVKPNIPPIALFTAEPIHATAGEDITFDASASFDPDGTIISWMWDFGDTTTGSGKKINHSYSTAGNYIVTLTVMDNDKSAHSNTTLIIVTDAKNTNNPEVSIKNPKPGSYILTIRAPNSAGLVSYSIDWGVQGLNPKRTPFFDPETQVSASYTYTQSGTYHITVIAYDENHQASLPTTIEIIVNLEENQNHQQAMATNVDIEDTVQGNVSISIVIVFGVVAVSLTILSVFRQKKKNKL